MNEDVFLMKKHGWFSACQCDPLMEGMPGWAPPHRCASSFCFEWILPTEKGRRKSELQKGKAFKGLAWIFCSSNVHFVTWPFKNPKNGSRVSNVRNLQTSRGSIFRCELLVSGRVSFWDLTFPKDPISLANYFWGSDPWQVQTLPVGRGQMIP